MHEEDCWLLLGSKVPGVIRSGWRSIRCCKRRGRYEVLPYHETLRRRVAVTASGGGRDSTGVDGAPAARDGESSGLAGVGLGGVQ